MPALLRSLLVDLAAGLRLVLFRRCPPDRIDARPLVIACLVVLVLVLSFGVDRLWFGPEGRIEPRALADNLLYLPLLLLAAVFAEHMLGRPGFALQFTAIVVAGSVWLAVVDLAVTFATQRGGSTDQRPTLFADVYNAIWAWWLGAVALYLMRNRTLGSARAIAAVAAYAAVFWFVNVKLPPTELWSPIDESADTARAPLTEEVLNAQPDLFVQALDGLEPQRPGVIDLYFVGVAGFAAEDVFLKEIDTISRLFDERFDTQGRSILLANNPQTATTLPFATSTNVADALQRVGAVMDADEDILFLYVTTHGSRNHELALSYGALELTDITPQSLRTMLDDAHIKWRVIVISACYSGGYVEPLRNENTMVMTASDATHTSFGCGTESDFTYFGRALFDEELRRTTSFERAFERARSTIARREQAAGEEPSNPQIFVGTAIRAKLAAFEKRLATPSRQVYQRAAPSARTRGAMRACARRSVAHPMPSQP